MTLGLAIGLCLMRIYGHNGLRRSAEELRLMGSVFVQENTG